ncbi:hypothetical protein E2C01_013143 [Portunus trituberculatus]|uniref:Uncharacterized protein n=1 Tax=Portunus trituberculatus TaxID=210409 RepID=A0A5B7DGA8_PORTR|nr:hypothetical protein [Portunus trituberculatus]
MQDPNIDGVKLREWRRLPDARPLARPATSNARATRGHNLITGVHGPHRPDLHPPSSTASVTPRGGDTLIIQSCPLSTRRVDSTQVVAALWESGIPQGSTEAGVGGVWRHAGVVRAPGTAVPRHPLRPEENEMEKQHQHSFAADSTHKAFTGLTLVYPTLAAAVGDIGLGLVGAGGTGVTLGAARQIHLRERRSQVTVPSEHMHFEHSDPGGVQTSPCGRSTPFTTQPGDAQTGTRQQLVTVVCQEGGVARQAVASVPSREVDAARVLVAAVQPQHTLIHVQLTGGAPEASPTLAHPRGNADPTVLTGSLANSCEVDEYTK